MRLPRIQLALWVGTTLASASACTILTDLDGFATSGTDGGALPDSAVQDSAVKDSAAEDVAEAAVDGGCGGDFCDDFDDGTVGATWTIARIKNGAIEHDVKNFVSAPRGVRATVVANSASGTAYLERAVGFRPKEITCTFQLHPNVAFPADSLDFFQVVGTGPGVATFLAKVGTLAGTSGQVRTDVVYTDGGCDCPLPNAGSFPAAPAVGAWTKVQVTFDFASIVVRYADKIVYSAPMALPFEPANVGVTLGPFDYSKKGTDLSFDDFVCRFSR